MKPRQAAPLTYRRLTEVLRYDPASGVFTWLKTLSNRNPAGRQAGSPDKHGHILICVDGVKYAAHRLAWLYMTKRWPTHEIDHRDLNAGNNKWENLREATHQQNVRNVGRKSHNKTGFNGVCRHSQAKHKFVAQITVDGRPKYIGLFNSPEEAHEAYVEASRRHHGDFGRAS